MGAILEVGLTDNPVIARRDELWSYSLLIALRSEMMPEDRKSRSAWPVPPARS